MSVFLRDDVFLKPEELNADVDDAYETVSSIFGRRAYALPPENFIVSYLGENNEWGYVKPEKATLPSRLMRVFMPMTVNELNRNLPQSPTFPSRGSIASFKEEFKPKALDDFSKIINIGTTKNKIQEDESLRAYDFRQLERAERLGGLSLEEKHILKKFRDRQRKEQIESKTQLNLLYKRTQESYEFKGFVSDEPSNRNALTFNSFINLDNKKNSEIPVFDGAVAESSVLPGVDLLDLMKTPVIPLSELKFITTSLPYGTIYLRSSIDDLNLVEPNLEPFSESVFTIELPKEVGDESIKKYSIIATEEKLYTNIYYINSNENIMEIGHNISNFLNEGVSGSNYYDAELADIQNGSLKIGKLSGTLQNYKKDAIKNYIFYIKTKHAARFADLLKQFNNEKFVIKCIEDTLMVIVDKSIDPVGVYNWIQQTLTKNVVDIQKKIALSEIRDNTISLPISLPNLSDKIVFETPISVNEVELPFIETQHITLKNIDIDESKLAQLVNQKLIHKGAYATKNTDSEWQIRSKNQNGINLAEYIAEIVDELVYQHTNAPVVNDFSYKSSLEDSLFIDQDIPSIISKYKTSIKDKVMKLYSLETGVQTNVVENHIIEKIIGNEIDKSPLIGVDVEKEITVNLIKNIIEQIKLLDSFKTNYTNEGTNTNFVNARLVENRFRNLLQKTTKEVKTESKSKPPTDKSVNSIHNTYENETIHEIVKIVEERSDKKIESKSVDIDKQIQKAQRDIEKKMKFELEFILPKMMKEERDQLLKESEAMLMKKLNG